MNGGEPVMHDEVQHISRTFDQVYIYPLYTHGNPSSLPSNCSVHLENFDHKRIRTYLREHGFMMLKLLAKEFLASPHRWWYVKNPRFVWNAFMSWKSLVYRLKEAKRELPKDTLLYSVWFNDWMNAAFLAKADDHFIISTRILGYDFDKRQHARNFILFREHMVNFPKYILGNSDYARRYYAANHPKALEKVKVFKFGVARHEYLNPGFSGVNIFVTVSAAVPLKRIELTIELLRSMTAPYHWYYFGSGPLLDDLRDMAAAKLPADSFTFMGQVPREQIYDFYRSNHVSLVLHQSSLESLPVSLMEAGSYGIPLAACDTCGVPEIVNAETGLLMPLDFDISLWSQKIESFLNSAGLTTVFRQGVKKYTLENFDIAVNAGKTCEFLKMISKEAVSQD
jgi:glycosyltransferase involved in cell wall biosynthesis